MLWCAVSRGTTRVLHGLALACEVFCSWTAEKVCFKIINPVSVVFQTAAVPVPLNLEKTGSKMSL